MTMTTGERVSQASVERLDLLEELRTREKASVKAAGERSKVRSTSNVDDTLQTLELAWQGEQAKSSSVCESDIAKVNAILTRLVERQERALADATGKQESESALFTEAHTDRIKVAQVLYEKEVTKVKKTQEDRDRNATANAHVAEKAVLDKRAEVEEQRVRAQRALGVDLAAFVNLPEEEV